MTVICLETGSNDKHEVVRAPINNEPPATIAL